MNKFFNATILCAPFYLFAQFYPVSQIDNELKKGAYAVIRQSTIDVQLNNQTEFKETKEVIISVLDKAGDEYVDAYSFYDPNTKIDQIEAEVYDATGKSVRKFKLKDFGDSSAVSGGQLYTDDRVKYLNFTPNFYPYTVRYKFVTTHKNTLFIPRWVPHYASNVAIESSKYNFTNNSTSTIRKSEKNLESYNVKSYQSGKTYSYELSNIAPTTREELAISKDLTIPQVIFATNEVNIDGTKGTFDNWNDYGKWSYESLVRSKLDFTPAQKNQFKELVKDAKDDKEKVKILYKHMQQKVRYIGVQLGVGGLSPFPNSYVESKSYGDCKALSNYFIGMLDAVGIKAYHTILYADRNAKDIDETMMYQQGNHMIVYIPLKGEDIWIEATSQDSPFNYLGSFGANRKVYIFDEKGGKIIPSQQFDHQNTILTSKGKITLSLDGKTNLELEEVSTGTFYDNNAYLASYTEKDQIDGLKRKLSGLGLPEIKSHSFDSNWDDAIFTTKVNATSNNYAKKQGNNIIFNLIPFNNEVSTLKKANDRKSDFNISRGYTDYMEFEFVIPFPVKNEIQFEPVKIESEFGNYVLTVEKTENNSYLIKRKYQQIKGDYNKSKYNDYVEFRRKVTASDNLKTLLEL